MKTNLTYLLAFLFILTLAACGGTEENAAHDVDAATQEEVARSSADAPGEAVAEMTDGVQVVRVRVTPMGYQPERIALQAGVPARLIFNRQDASACTEQVQIPAFDVEATTLPQGEDVAIEFTPEEAGEYTFVCGMDMQRGTLVVKS